MLVPIYTDIFTASAQNLAEQNPIFGIMALAIPTSILPILFKTPFCCVNYALEKCFSMPLSLQQTWNSFTMHSSILSFLRMADFICFSFSTNILEQCVLSTGEST